MNALVKNTVFASALVALSALGATSQANAQEVAMVYASNVTATNSLSNVNATLTPQMLAREFSKELSAELKVRLPKEQAELADALRIKEEFNASIIQELDARLLEEIRNFSAVVTD